MNITPLGSGHRPGGPARRGVRGRERGGIRPRRRPGSDGLPGRVARIGLRGALHRLSVQGAAAGDGGGRHRHSKGWPRPHLRPPGGAVRPGADRSGAGPAATLPSQRVS